MRMKISIYNGEGVSQRHLQTLLEVFPQAQLLSPHALIDTDWDHAADLLIIPGGRDRPYHRDLSGAGNQKIAAFVEAGGGYLGICAGAYYGCAAIDFERGHPGEIIESRELSFFAGTAVGPAYGLGKYDPSSEAGARSARVQFANTEFDVYFNGGPTFRGADPRSRVVARYADLPDQPPAILHSCIGAGWALLSGVHLENNPQLLQQVLKIGINPDDSSPGHQ